MSRPSATNYVGTVVNDDKHLRANTVLLHCAGKKVSFQIAPCMSGDWQCQQVSNILQAIIDTAYNAGKIDAEV